jgi:DNA-binding IclR family transcriptional regulator
MIEHEAAGSGELPRTSTTWRLVTLIELAATTDGGIGVREAARRTGIDKSAVSRLFAHLERMHVVEQSEVRGRYTVGPRLFAISAAVRPRDSLWRAARPILERLVADTNETCYLTLRAGSEVIFQEKVDCTHVVRYVVDLGRGAPLHVGASGRAILAGLDDADRDAVLSGPLEPVTERTLVDRDALREHALADRVKGYTTSMGERVPHGNAVAAPYFAADGACLGSITWTCPAERFDPDMVPSIGARVVAAANDLSARLGFTGSWPRQVGTPLARTAG